MAHDVFISYSSTDKTAADAVCARLESRGIGCWIAPRDVIPGEEYAAALVRALQESRLMLLLFSSRSNQSPQVLREVERAVSKGLAILPLRIENATPTAAMEYYISSCQWFDALTPPFERHLDTLAQTVAELLSRLGRVVPARPAPSAVMPATKRAMWPRFVAAAALMVAAGFLWYLLASRAATGNARQPAQIAPVVRGAAAGDAATGQPQPAAPLPEPGAPPADISTPRSPVLAGAPTASAEVAKAPVVKSTPKPSDCARLLERVSLGEEDLLTAAEKTTLRQCGK